MKHLQPRALIAGLFLSFLALGLAVAVLGPSLPHLARATASALRLVSFVFIAHRMGYILGSYLGGVLYDRLSGTRLMAASLLVLAAALLLVPAQRLLAPLLAVVFALGLSEGSVDVGGNALLLWLKPRRLPVLMNALHLFFGIGAFLGPLALALAVRWSGGILWGYRALSLLVLPPAVLLLRLAGPSPRHAAPGVAIPAGPGAAGGQPLPEARREPTPRAGSGFLTALVVLLLFLTVAGEAGFGDWIYTYALTRGVADPVRSGYLTSVYWGSYTVGRLAATLVSFRVKPRGLLVGSFLGCILSVSVLLLWPHSRPLAWAVSVGFGLSMAAVFPAVLTLAGESLTVTGRTTGLFLVGAALGGMAVPWLIGQFFESAGPWVAPAAILIAVSAGFAVLLAVLGAVRRRGGR